MNLQKACEILDLWVNNKPIIPASKLHVAVRLGIAAGEHILNGRAKGYEWVDIPLPGETED